MIIFCINLHRLVCQSTTASSSDEVSDEDNDDEGKESTSNGNWDHVVDSVIRDTLVDWRQRLVPWILFSHVLPWFPDASVLKIDSLT